MFDANSTGISVSNPKLFADFAPGFTDGIRYDTEGNVWCSCGWGHGHIATMSLERIFRTTGHDELG
jgi:sugar lactone lactonase YvrE